jgi:hypothetical protein
MEHQEHLPAGQQPRTEVLALQICQLQNVPSQQSLLCCMPETISANPETTHQLMVFKQGMKNLHTMKVFLFKVFLLFTLHH